MRLNTYRAETLAHAMAQIRAELGPDALIVGTRHAAGGAEVTACLESAPAAPAPAREAGQPQGEPPARPLARTRQWRPRPLSPALAWHGAPQGLIGRLAGPDLAASLGRIFRFGTLPLDAETPLLLAGAPGAGKTLTTARLATRLVLAGQTPLVVSADGRRAGAAEELAAYTRLLGIELVVANRPATLARALRLGSPGPVLIDTAGVNPFDPAQMQDIQALAAEARAHTILVMAAGADPNEAADHADIFASAGIDHLLPTRLDIARRLGAVLAAADAGAMTLSEAGTGPGATDGLTPLDGATLAARLHQTAPASGGQSRSAPSPSAHAGRPRERPAFNQRPVQTE